jgi:TRAP-type C4-dicarboxylate transport system permease small subunit
LQWIDSRLEHWLMSLFYIYLCLILVIEVALRALGSSIIWAVETSLYAFIWLTYVSAAQLARDRQHLCFTLVRNSLGRRGQFACLALSDLSLALVCVVIAGYMWKPLTDTIRFDLQMTGIDLPLWLAMVAVPFGWLLVLVRVVQRFWRSWDDFRNGRPLLLQGPVA